MAFENYQQEQDTDKEAFLFTYSFNGYLLNTFCMLDIDFSDNSRERKETRSLHFIKEDRQYMKK